MCYSAQIRADYAKLVRHYGATMSLDDFARLYTADPGKKRPRTPKAMDDGFAGARTEQGRQIVAMIEHWHALERAELEQTLEHQRTRRDKAAAALALRPTQKAHTELRVASTRIERAQARLEDLQRSQPLPQDSRIFPGLYAPVMISRDGQRTLAPMRYQCRLPDKDARSDVLYPGTYNARRESLEGYWRGAFGQRHGVVVVSAFYEHVAGSRGAGSADGTQDAVLEFRPEPPQDLLLACLWSQWEGPEGALLSFAIITDAPPADVAAAGHDRGVIPLREEHLDAWLNPDPHDLAAQYRILDDRLDLRYAYRKAG